MFTRSFWDYSLKYDNKLITQAGVGFHGHFNNHLKADWSRYALSPAYEFDRNKKLFKIR